MAEEPLSPYLAAGLGLAQPGDTREAIATAVGNIASSMAVAELILDSLGYALLNGDFIGWITLADRMGIRMKWERVRDLARAKLKDGPVKAAAMDFITKFDPLIKERNDAIHSLYLPVDGGFTRVKLFKPKPTEPVRVTSMMLNPANYRDNCRVDGVRRSSVGTG